MEFFLRSLKMQCDFSENAMCIKTVHVISSVKALSKHHSVILHWFGFEGLQLALRYKYENWTCKICYIYPCCLWFFRFLQPRFIILLYGKKVLHKWVAQMQKCFALITSGWVNNVLLVFKNSLPILLHFFGLSAISLSLAHYCVLDLSQTADQQPATNGNLSPQAVSFVNLRNCFATMDWLPHSCWQDA